MGTPSTTDPMYGVSSSAGHARRPGLSEPPSALELWRRMQEHVRDEPYQALAMAAGVGFVLGGGLFTRLAGSLLANTVRLGIAGALSPAARELIMHMRESEPERMEP